MLFDRQPDSRRYVDVPARWFMDWYYLRLLITVTPTQVNVRPPLTSMVAPGGAGPASGGAAGEVPVDGLLGAGSGPGDLVRTLSNARRATKRYLQHRGLQRPRVR